MVQQSLFGCVARALLAKLKGEVVPLQEHVWSFGKNNMIWKSPLWLCQGLATRSSFLQGFSCKMLQGALDVALGEESHAACLG